jgi:hypothetical protein
VLLAAAFVVALATSGSARATHLAERVRRRFGKGKGKGVGVGQGGGEGMGGGRDEGESAAAGEVGAADSSPSAAAVHAAVDAPPRTSTPTTVPQPEVPPTAQHAPVLADGGHVRDGGEVAATAAASAGAAPALAPALSPSSLTGAPPDHDTPLHTARELDSGDVTPTGAHSGSWAASAADDHARSAAHLGVVLLGSGASSASMVRARPATRPHGDDGSNS